MASVPSYVLQGTFGFAPEVWEAAKDEIRGILIEKARQRRNISYSDLVARVNAIHFNARDIRLNGMLGQLAMDEHEAGRPLLSALVVHKDGDMQPGPGFFELAEALGRDIRDIETIWIDEVGKVYRQWA